MRRIFFEGLVILGLSVGLALGHWIVRSRDIADKVHYGVPGISRAAAEQLKAGGRTVLWVQIHPETASRLSSMGDIQVIHLDTWEGDLSRLLEAWNPEDVVIVSASSEARPAARQAAERLDRAGLPSVFLLAWEKNRL